jgi:cobalt-zinc-cadmium efflux system outer membrane protein
MKSLVLCGALCAGLGLVWSSAGLAQGEPVTLEDALRQSGVVAGEAEAQINPRLVGPQADVEAAEALVGQARLRPNPEASFEAENIVGTGAYSGLQSSEYTLSAGLPIELGGKRGARIRAAEAALEVARLTGQLSVADVGLAVRQRYVAAVAAEQRVELAQGVYDRNRELLRVASALVDAGREPPLHSLRAEAELAQAEAELKAAQAEALSTRFVLGAMIPGEDVPVVGSIFPELRPPYSVLGDYSGIEPRLARAERDAAQESVGLERSLGRPDLTASAGVRRFEESNDQAFVVGVSIPLPLWNRNQGNIAAAEAKVRAATARETVALADYQQQVAEARAAYLAAEAKADTLEEKSLPQAEEALRLADIGYRNGKFPLIEVLGAADARDEIRHDLIDAREAQGKAAALLIRLAAQ